MKNKDNRSTNALIKEYELLALPQNYVYEIYKDRYENADKYKWNSDIDEWTDQALWEKGDQLTKLAIARYGTNKQIARSILDGNERVLRLALLASFNTREWFDNNFPRCLFKDENETIKYLKNCPEEDICELMSNPSLSRGLMESFFEQKEVYQELSESKRMLIARLFGRHPIATTNYDRRYMDGWAEYSHGKVFGYAWQFCNKVNVNKGWAICLSEMTEKLLTYTFGSSFENDSEVESAISRWYPSGDELTEYDDENYHKKSGYLSTWQTVRKNLARHFSSSKDKKIENDIAVRYLHYESEWLSPDDMDEAFEKDSITALNALMDNENLWKKEITRQKLHDLCWDADKLDEHHYLDNANKFNAYEDRHKKQHAAWFVSDSNVNDLNEISDGDLPVNRKYLYEMLEVVVKQINQAQTALDQNNKNQKVILYLVAGIAIFTLYKFS